VLLLLAATGATAPGTAAAGVSGPAAGVPAPPAQPDPVETPPDGTSSAGSPGPAAGHVPHAGGVGPGYALVTASGTVGTFGGAGFDGDLSTRHLTATVVGMAATRDGRGYWLATRGGQVFAFGDAAPAGGRRAAAPATPAESSRPTVAIVADPDGPGCWTVDDGGGVHPLGAPDLGGLTPPHIPPVVVAAAPAAGGQGLWLLGPGGGIARVGRAARGAVTPPTTLPHVDDGAPAVAIAATPGERGYWVASANGAVRTSGDAGHPRPPGGLASPVTALVPAPGGGGYLLVLSDGTVVAMGSAVDLGDARSPLHPPLYPASLAIPATDLVGGGYLATGPQPARTGPLRATFLGDSVSVVIGRYTNTDLVDDHLGASAVAGGILGCGVTGNLPLSTYADPTAPEPTLPACGQWQQQYLRSLALAHPDVVIVELGYWESQVHLLAGRSVTTVDSPTYRALLTAQLGRLVAMVRAAGARLLLLDAPFYGDGTPAANVDGFDALLATVARAHRVPVLDLRRILDPGGRYRTVVDGVVARTPDRVHVTVAGVRAVIDPVLVPRLLQLARAGRRSA
jgi:hypothetical protein